MLLIIVVVIILGLFKIVFVVCDNEYFNLLFLWIELGYLGVVWLVVLLGNEKYLNKCVIFLMFLVIWGNNLVYELLRYVFEVIIWLLWFGLLMKNILRLYLFMILFKCV